MMSFSRISFCCLAVVSLSVFACDKGKPSSNSNPAPIKNVNTGNLNQAQNSAAAKKEAVPQYTYEVVKSYRHDPDAFTQGLVVRDGVFYESAGQYGESSLRKVDIASGRVLQKYELPDEYFAEGMTIIGDKAYQITWRENKAFVYNLKDFKLEKEFTYSGEGWGLTNDGKSLYHSDGTHVIRVINPENYQTERTITVLQENGQPLMKLNELEYIKGEIWANIWHDDAIARIDPQSGKLLGYIDLGKLAAEEMGDDSERVLNGIAYDEAADKLYVTGKNWKKVYEVKVKPKE